MRAILILGLSAVVPGFLAAAEPIDYGRDIQPILTKHCTSCHGAKKQRSSLRLDSVRAARRGGNSGPALVPGKSDASRLIIAITGGNDDVHAMPPKGPRLSASDVARLRAWIDGGAVVPANETASGIALRTEEPNTGRSSQFGGLRNRRSRTRVGAAMPSIASSSPGWRNDGIAPAPEADRVTLLRRVALDLIGLPPSPKDIDDFLSDKRADAYERVVDRLLASPHYGERWGRHWLDLARYADSNGYSIDSPRSIWKYRDWVIDAFNNDKPFDRFVIEQLAGDLLPKRHDASSASPRASIATRRKTRKAASIRSSSASSRSSIAPTRPARFFSA